MLRKGFKVCICVMLAIAIMASIVGCGASAGSTTTTSAVSSSDTTTATATAAPAAPVDITWQTWGYEHASMDPAIADAMASDFPNVNVKFNLVPYADHYTKLKVDLASGAGSDVFDIQDGAPATQFAEFCEPIGPLAEKAIGADWQTKFTDYALKQDAVNGAPVGLPCGIGGNGVLWVNKTLLDKYNVQPPKTLDDLKALSATFRKNGQLPFSIGAKDSWINEDVFQSIANDINSSKLYDALDGKVKWTDPDLIKALDVWQKLFTDKTAQDGALGMNMYNDTYDIFLKNMIPVIPVGLWMINNYTGNDTFKKNVADGNSYMPIRFPDVNGDGKAPGLLLGLNAIVVVNKNSTHKDEAMLFAKSLTMGKIYQKMLDILWYLPTVKDTKPQGQYDTELQSNLDLITSWLGDVAGSRQIKYPELQKAIDDQLQALAAGQSTPQKAAETIETASAAQKR